MTNKFDALPQYKSHKIVRAGRIVRIQTYTDEVVLHLQERDSQDVIEITCPVAIVARYVPVPNDYFMVYEDGYQSISPREAFESGYTKLERQGNL